MLSIPMTAAEAPGFQRDAWVALTGEVRMELITFLAANPEAGPGPVGVERFAGRQGDEANAVASE